MEIVGYKVLAAPRNSNSELHELWVLCSGCRFSEIGCAVFDDFRLAVLRLRDIESERERGVYSGRNFTAFNLSSGFFQYIYCEDVVIGAAAITGLLLCFVYQDRVLEYDIEIRVFDFNV